MRWSFISVFTTQRWSGCIVVPLAAKLSRWPMKPSSGHLHTDMWNTAALPHRPGTENRIMDDLPMQNIPQAWLCMALTFSLSGWCLFKRGSPGTWSCAAQKRPTQSSALRLTSSLSLCHLHNSVHFSSREGNSAWLKVSPAHFSGLKSESQFPPVKG